MDCPHCHSSSTTEREGRSFPAEVIGLAVFLYYRFPLSLRMVEEMQALRGIVLSHETVRRRALKFGREYAARLRRRLPRGGGKWHLDEVALTIAGRRHWPWRAVDRDGFTLDVPVQGRRDEKAAKRLLRKLLKKQARAPRVLVTDKLASYAAARKEPGLGGEHRRRKGLNHRAENSHQPTRRRERRMTRFKSPRQAQRFPSVHDRVADLFHRRPDHVTAAERRAARTEALATWAEVTGAVLAAWAPFPAGPRSSSSSAGPNKLTVPRRAEGEAATPGA